MSARSLDISKSKCPKLEKSYDKKKYYMSKDKKGPALRERERNQREEEQRREKQGRDATKLRL